MMNKKLLKNLFITIAIVSIIFAVLCFVLDSGNTEWDYTYGGDAYTGIQNAAAKTANNLVATNNCIKTISSFAFIIVGLAFGSIGISIKTDKTNEELSTEPKSDNENNNVEN